MKLLIPQATQLTALFLASSLCVADITETIDSVEPTTYCVPQTLVRGGYQNLVIDHNMIIPPADHSKKGDIFVGARLKSQPEVLWLLKGISWQQITSSADLRNAQHLSFEHFPLLIPVSIFYTPTDVSQFVGDLEIWIGYGLRSATESAEDAFNEMTASERYEILWRALPSPYSPQSGVHSPSASLCLETTTVKKTILTAKTAIRESVNVDSAQ